MTQLILIRHGETAWNIQGRYQGQTDIPLSTEGSAQARSVANRLKKEKIDALYASDLQRAVVTAKTIAQDRGLPVVSDARLRETSFGIWEGLTRKEIQEQYDELYQERRTKFLSTRVPDGELPEEVLTRAFAAIYDIITKHPKGKVVIVSHGGALRLVLCKILQIPMQQGHHFYLTNTGISRVKYLSFSDQFIIQCINDTTHLR